MLYSNSSNKRCLRYAGSGGAYTSARGMERRQSGCLRRVGAARFIDQLRRLASDYMRGERPGHLLQTTALVNEAYLRLSHVSNVAVGRWNLSTDEVRGVDEFVAARASRFQTAQQTSTSAPHLLETQALENRRFYRSAGNCLGRRGSGVQIAPPRPTESNRCALYSRGREICGSRKSRGI